METILPASRNYQVSAGWEGFSLDDYALLRKDDRVQPFFVYPIKNDPDVSSVTVSFNSGSFADESETRMILEHWNGNLPPFTMPEMEAGSYMMVFNVYGKNQVLLSKTEKSIFYIKDLDYEITGIGVYLPAGFIPSHLIPADITIMLDASIKADPGLDPYIFWYNGRTRISEGKISEGAGRLLWKVPSQSGFENIRAEVIPFPPGNEDQPNTGRPDRMHRGKTRGLSLPVSTGVQLQRALSEIPELAEESGLSIIGDFGLAGDLADSINPGIKISGQPYWHPVKGVYGLGTGPAQYHLLFEIPENGISFIQGFYSLDDGCHFYFSFGEDDYGNENTIGLYREESRFLLISCIDGNEESFNLNVQTDDFIILKFDFTVNENSFGLSVKDRNNLRLSGTTRNIRLPGSAILNLGDTLNETENTVMVLGGLVITESEDHYSDSADIPD